MKNTQHAEFKLHYAPIFEKVKGGYLISARSFVCPSCALLAGCLVNYKSLGLPIRDDEWIIRFKK